MSGGAFAPEVLIPVNQSLLQHDSGGVKDMAVASSKRMANFHAKLNQEQNDTGLQHDNVMACAGHDWQKGDHGGEGGRRRL